MSTNLRIHIAPLGHDTKRIVQPIIDDKVDKLYLIIHEHETSYIKYIQYVKENLEKDLPNLEIIQETSDLWDVLSCVKCFKKIIKNEIGNNVQINLSSGSKITAIAGILVCMTNKDVIPYYAHVQYHREKILKPVIEEYEEKRILPVFALDAPEKTHLIILKILSEEKRELNKSDLIKILKRKKILKTKNSKFPANALQNQVRKFLDPMQKLGYLKIIEDGRDRFISITTRGQEILDVWYEEDVEYN